MVKLESEKNVDRTEYSQKMCGELCKSQWMSSLIRPVKLFYYSYNAKSTCNLSTLHMGGVSSLGDVQKS
jgi:hypothetical protein